MRKCLFHLLYKLYMCRMFPLHLLHCHISGAAYCSLYYLKISQSAAHLLPSLEHIPQPVLLAELLPIVVVVVYLSISILYIQLCFHNAANYWSTKFICLFLFLCIILLHSHYRRQELYLPINRKDFYTLKSQPRICYWIISAIVFLGPLHHCDYASYTRK